MNRFALSLIFTVLFNPFAFSQSGTDSTIHPASDSVIQTDSLKNADSLSSIVVSSSTEVSVNPHSNETWKNDSVVDVKSSEFVWNILMHHPYYGFNSTPDFSVRQESDRHRFIGKDWIFYLLILLLILFSFLKNSFPKYFADLFRVFFRTTLKQRQISEQMLQAPLPSLLLNIFFIINGGLYISLLFKHYNKDPAGNFWLLFLYCCLAISSIYLIKFIGLKISGWLFSMKVAADSYIFIVFIINKVVGIILFPFLILLAFAVDNIYIVSLALSWFVLGVILLYRVVLSFAAIRNQVSINPFHFFLYILAFEIAPLLLIYRVLLEILRITT